MVTVDTRSRISLESEVGWLINRLNRRRADLLERLLEPIGLSARGLALLIAVAELPDPVSQQEICAALLLDQASVASVADRLEAAELVSRQRNPRNRRRYIVSLTPFGSEVLSQARLTCELAEDQMRAGLTEEEARTLYSLLHRVGVANGMF